MVLSGGSTKPIALPSTVCSGFSFAKNSIRLLLKLRYPPSINSKLRNLFSLINHNLTK